MIATVYTLLQGATGAKKRRCWREEEAEEAEEEGGWELYVGGTLVSTSDISKEIG